jgi:NAD(P)-dependent dehydrogenase (short-subunit alcohol dehydrogenase family)
MNRQFDLTGRVALVTGGSKGLGKAMARAFAEAGAEVAICSRDEEELKSAIREICDGTNAKGAYFTADLTQRPQVERLARRAIERFGHIDILVNNAGSNAPQPIDRIRDDVWDRLVELNLTAGMVLCRALVPGMKERRWGRIIHISSIMGLASKEGRHVYSATKAGLIGMARAGAIELGPYGITVNCIAPGPFLTDLNLSGMSEEDRALFTERTALGRWGDPRELAGPALLLASPAGGYITGATLVVDGGVLCKTF